MARVSGLLVVLLALLAHNALAFRFKNPLQNLNKAAKPQTTVADWVAPWFCHDIECPEFEVVDKLANDTIEVRKYAPGTWASTEIKDISYDNALRDGFWRLFKYISGDNESKTKIEMTAPVKVRAVASQGPFCESRFIMSFFVSPSFKSLPPAPTSDQVFIEQVPETTYYVASYGGYAPEKKVVRHARDLQQTLQAAGLAFKDDHFFSAGYDSPFRLVGRHNEIWVEQAQPKP